MRRPREKLVIHREGEEGTKIFIEDPYKGERSGSEKNNTHH
jgi:hypothetical protein